MTTDVKSLRFILRGLPCNGGADKLRMGFGLHETMAGTKTNCADLLSATLHNTTKKTQHFSKSE